jgi:CheY-like chemotaxis protein
MGGEIGLMPAEGGGSIFWVTLPLEEKSVRGVGALLLKGKRVGIVSPSRILREGIGLQLAAAGALIAEATSMDGLPRRPHGADIVLVDHTPDANGFPDMGPYGIPAVALLLPHQRSGLSALAEKGIAAYLMKPIRQSSLEQRLAAVLAGEIALADTSVAPPAQQRMGGALAILLAEDNPVNALLARELLRRRGHAVQQVATGEAAIEACARKRFDIVIMDVHMPRVDGIEATRRIRLAETMTGGKRTPIFALTADALDTGRKACLEAGMDGFLTKPVDPAELDSVLATIHPPAIVAAE